MRPALLPLVLLSLSCAPGADHSSEVDSGPPSQQDMEESVVNANRYTAEDGTLRVTLVKQPYHGSRNVPELSRNPDYLEEGGLVGVLRDSEVRVAPVATVKLTDEEEREYGEWHRLGLANGHLADIVAANEKGGLLSIGLLANCNALLGMLGGYQSSGELGDPRTVGLVWVDAHGDFNTPETTLSGMLGGMPVAVSAGLALERLRKESHLDLPISVEHIVMAAVRDTDPEEQELLEAHRIAMLSTQDLRDRSEALRAQMERLSDLTDLIYVHVDMDVLDPVEVPGHGLTVPGGPTSQELSEALTEIFRYPKVAGLGIASTPSYEDDPGGVSRQAAYRLIQGALKGVAER